jgi:hypothetical protein
MRGWRIILWLLVFSATVSVAHAHVGSKDIYEDMAVGRYKLYLTVRPPVVIPGVATVDVQSSGAHVSRILITPTPMTGEGADHPPVADVMTKSGGDDTSFAGSLWLMKSGSWEVHFQIEGDDGTRTMSIPVPAVALSTLKMQRGMGTMLGVLGFLLVGLMAGIVWAAVRESELVPGTVPDARRRRHALIATACSLILMALVLWGGAKWWNVEAASYAMKVYKPMVVTPQLQGGVLELQIRQGEDKESLSNDDFLPDHGHLMHLYAVREPQMDAVYHLHPERISKGEFRETMPSLPPGKYALYTDVVHANGFPETMLSSITVPPGFSGAPLLGDDAGGQVPSVEAGQPNAEFTLPDGYKMVWDKPAELKANTAYRFHFRVVDAHGEDTTDMVPYMGMAGHAAFIKNDGTVFAHVHPEGSAAMAAVMMANADQDASSSSMAMDMPGMDMSSTKISNVVDFPYGFPSTGQYRIVVQVKRAGQVETSVFDAAVK